MSAMSLKRIAAVLLLLVAGSNAGGCQTEPTSSWEGAANLLATSHDREALEKAAIALASSADPQAVTRLGEFLRQPEFLARLDEVASPTGKTWHLQRVLASVGEHPSAATERVCLALAADSAFLAIDDRRIYLLPALAAVRPMGQAAVAVFREATAEGYYNLNVLLLANNGSARALGLFEEMIRDKNIPVDQRVDALHSSLLPNRTNPAMLDCADRLLDGPLERGVAIGVIERIFDDHSARWFPPIASPPTPTAWEEAPKPALKKVLAMADKVKGRRGLPPELTAAVNRTADTVQRILTGNS